MGSDVTPDGALGNGRLSVGELGYWLNAYVFQAASAFCSGHDIAATARDAIVWRVSGRGAARIHMSAMSDRWLRMHETDCDKHGTEF